METTSSESEVEDMESFVIKPVMRKSPVNNSSSRYGTLVEGSLTSSYETTFQSSNTGSHFQDSTYVPPPYSYILNLPTCDTRREENVSIGHQALADGLELSIPLANFPAEQKSPWKPPVISGSPSSSSSASNSTSWNPWKYEGYHENTHMFSIPSDNSIYAVAGISIINQDPRCVWDVLKNPACRMVYDRMLCGYQVLDIINEYTKLMKMKFTMKHCISLVERELVCVQSERQLSHTSFIASARSINYPESNSVHTENLKCATCLVEGIQTNVDSTDDTKSTNQLQTKVIYILKLELPSLPKVVVEYILKRQPLCIAYAKMRYGWS